jgi:peptidoglycan glycosyltransferase
MYSNPSYDPNLVAQHDGAAALEYLQTLQADPEKPLLGNAFQERYMPGSTFKILTTAIGLETGVMSTASTFPGERAWVPPNTNRPIRNYDGRVCGGDLAEVFRRSCNIPFAKTAVEIGPSEMVAGVKRFALGQRLPIDLQGAASSTFGGEAADFENSLALLAIHGFGQGGVQMVPLHMAMISASVANGGQMLEPHVTAQTLRDDSTLVVANGALTYDPADVVSTTQPTPWRRTMAPETAATLTNLMIGVTESGTAACCLQIPGVKIAAKTGTAQLNPEGEQERSHAWITAFAPADAPRIAVAVMLKGTTDEISAGTGGRLAGPVARELLQKALQVVP